MSETLSIAPEAPIQEDVYQRLLDRLPVSDWYLRAPTTVPYSQNPTPFILKTNRFGAGAPPHQIRVNGVLQTAVVPERERSRVLLRLPLGQVEVIVDNGFEYSQLMMATSNLAAVLSGIAKEIYLNVRKKIDDNDAAIRSPFGARMIEHHLAFQDLLPAHRAPRTQAAKMAIRAMIQGFGTEPGVKDFVTALAYSSPEFVDMEAEREHFDPKVYPIIRKSHDFSGVEIHIWVPNLCVFSWLTFIRVVDNVDAAWQLTHVTENQVTLTVNGVEERHVFDADSEACVDSLRQLIDCLDGIHAYAEWKVSSSVAVCAASYPFDMLVEEPLGIGDRFDTGELVDEAGFELDGFNELDPTFNGWEGESLVDRFDGDHCLDTFGNATTVDDLACCWEGQAVTGQLHTGFDVNINATPGDTGAGPFG